MDPSQASDADLRAMILDLTKILESRHMDTAVPSTSAPKPTVAPKPGPPSATPAPVRTQIPKPNDDPNTLYLTSTKRRRTAPAPTPAPQGLPTRNRFDALTDNTPESPIDKDAPTDEIATASSASSTARRSVPPFIIRDKDNWTKISKALNDARAHYIKATPGRDGVNIYTASEDDYRKMYRTLETLKTPFHTFQLRSEKSLRVVIRGVLQSITCEEIKDDLIAQQYDIINIKRLNGRDNRPAPLVMVELDKKYKSIYNLAHCCGLNVTVESKRVLVGQRQCHKCQLYGHTQPNCHADYRCMKCAGPHSTHECPKPKTTPAKCANCGGEHTSIYSKCPKNPNQYTERPQTQTNRPQFRLTSYSSAARGPVPQQFAAAPAAPPTAAPTPTSSAPKSNSQFNSILGEMLATLFAANPMQATGR